MFRYHIVVLLAALTLLSITPTLAQVSWPLNLTLTPHSNYVQAEWVNRQDATQALKDAGLESVQLQIESPSQYPPQCIQDVYLFSFALPEHVIIPKLNPDTYFSITVLLNGTVQWWGGVTTLPALRTLAPDTVVAVTGSIRILAIDINTGVVDSTPLAVLEPPNDDLSAPHTFDDVELPHTQQHVAFHFSTNESSTTFITFTPPSNEFSDGGFPYRTPITVYNNSVMSTPFHIWPPENDNTDAYRVRIDVRSDNNQGTSYIIPLRRKPLTISYQNVSLSWKDRWDTQRSLVVLVPSASTETYSVSANVDAAQGDEGSMPSVDLQVNLISDHPTLDEHLSITATWRETGSSTDLDSSSALSNEVERTIYFPEGATTGDPGESHSYDLIVTITLPEGENKGHGEHLPVSILVQNLTYIVPPGASSNPTTPTATPTVTPTVTPTATPTVTPTATPTQTPVAGPRLKSLDFTNTGEFAFDPNKFAYTSEDDTLHVQVTSDPVAISWKAEVEESINGRSPIPPSVDITLNSGQLPKSSSSSITLPPTYGEDGCLRVRHNTVEITVTAGDDTTKYTVFIHVPESPNLPSLACSIDNTALPLTFEKNTLHYDVTLPYSNDYTGTTISCHVDLPEKGNVYIQTPQITLSTDMNYVSMEKEQNRYSGSVILTDNELTDLDILIRSIQPTDSDTPPVVYKLSLQRGLAPPSPGAWPRLLTWALRGTESQAVYNITDLPSLPTDISTTTDQVVLTVEDPLYILDTDATFQLAAKAQNPRTTLEGDFWPSTTDGPRLSDGSWLNDSLVLAGTTPSLSLITRLGGKTVTYIVNITLVPQLQLGSIDVDGVSEKRPITEFEPAKRRYDIGILLKDTTTTIYFNLPSALRTDGKTGHMVSLETCRRENEDPCPDTEWTSSNQIELTRDTPGHVYAYCRLSYKQEVHLPMDILPVPVLYRVSGIMSPTGPLRLKSVILWTSGQPEGEHALQQPPRWDYEYIITDPNEQSLSFKVQVENYGELQEMLSLNWRYHDADTDAPLVSFKAGATTSLKPLEGVTTLDIVYDLPDIPTSQKQTFSVKIRKATDESGNTLKSISFTPQGELTPVFSENQLQYKLALPPSTPNIVINPSPTEIHSKVTVLIGNNIVQIDDVQNPVQPTITLPQVIKVQVLAPNLKLETKREYTFEMVAAEDHTGEEILKSVQLGSHLPVAVPSNQVDVNVSIPDLEAYSMQTLTLTTSWDEVEYTVTYGLPDDQAILKEIDDSPGTEKRIFALTYIPGALITIEFSSKVYTVTLLESSTGETGTGFLVSGLTVKAVAQQETMADAEVVSLTPSFTHTTSEYDVTLSADQEAIFLDLVVQDTTPQDNSTVNVMVVAIVTLRDAQTNEDGVKVYYNANLGSPKPVASVTDPTPLTTSLIRVVGGVADVVNTTLKVIVLSDDDEMTYLLHLRRESDVTDAHLVQLQIEDCDLEPTFAPFVASYSGSIDVRDGSPKTIRPDLIPSQAGASLSFELWNVTEAGAPERQYEMGEYSFKDDSQTTEWHLKYVPSILFLNLQSSDRSHNFSYRLTLGLLDERPADRKVVFIFAGRLSTFDKVAFRHALAAKLHSAANSIEVVKAVPYSSGKPTALRHLIQLQSGGDGAPGGNVTGTAAGQLHLLEVTVKIQAVRSGVDWVDPQSEYEALLALARAKDGSLDNLGGGVGALYRVLPENDPEQAIEVHSMDASPTKDGDPISTWYRSLDEDEQKLVLYGGGGLGLLILLLCGCCCYRKCCRSKQKRQRLPVGNRGSDDDDDDEDAFSNIRSSTHAGDLEMQEIGAHEIDLDVSDDDGTPGTQPLDSFALSGSDLAGTQTTTRPPTKPVLPVASTSLFPAPSSTSGSPSTTLAGTVPRLQPPHAAAATVTRNPLPPVAAAATSGGDPFDIFGDDPPTITPSTSTTNTTTTTAPAIAPPAAVNTNPFLLNPPPATATSAPPALARDPPSGAPINGGLDNNNSLI